MNSSEVSSIISSTINDIFNKLFSSIDNSLYSTLDDFTFINIDVLKDSYFIDIFGLSSKTGILVVANSLILGYLLYYAFKLLFAHIGITEVEKPSKFLFKLLISSICMNFSLFICDEIIYLISLLSSSIREIGESLFNTPVCFSSLISRLDSIISLGSDNLDIFSLDGIVKTIISFSLLNLIITYAVRYVLIKVFVILSPFAFLSLSNKNTSILFKSWIKSFLSLMLIQVFVSIILLLIFSLKISSNNISSKFILIGALFILIKANHYVREMLGGISSDVNIGLNNLKTMTIK